MSKTRIPDVWWETTDENALVRAGARFASVYGLGHRPTETEADLIAAAAPSGSVTVRSMIELCLDECANVRALELGEPIGTAEGRENHLYCGNRYSRLGPALGGPPLEVHEYLEWLDLGACGEDEDQAANHDFWSRPSLWAEGGPRL